MIYNLDSKGIKKELYEFHKSEYGKTIFVICYSLFFLLFSATIVCLIGKFLCFEYFIFLSLSCLISFLIGSYNFYKELRIFVNRKK